MPPALNHVSTKKVAAKNADDFPHDRFPPYWRLVKRRGVILGYIWHRNQGFEVSDRDRTIHVTLPDLTEIATFAGGRAMYHPDAVEALVDYHDTASGLARG